MTIIMTYQRGFDPVSPRGYATETHARRSIWPNVSITLGLMLAKNVLSRAYGNVDEIMANIAMNQMIVVSFLPSGRGRNR